MDFSIITEHVLPHWPFLVMAAVLGLLCRTMKKNVWTKENAKKSRIIHWIRAFLPLHAPFLGAMIAGVGELLGGFPVSPGIEGIFAVMLYHAGSGWASSYIYVLLRHFAKSRGIDVGGN